jgi:hypothetical protein
MPNPEPPMPKKRGCFFYGCITSLIILFVLVVGFFIAVRLAIRWGNNMVAQYTDTSAMTVPKTDMRDDEIKALKARVAAFNSAVDARSNTPPLVLTSREINTLVATSPDLKDYKDKFYVTLEGDTVKGQISLPLEGLVKMPFVDVKGRYLNGSGTFKASVNNGELSVFVEELEARGKPLPDKFMAGIKAQNLAQGFNNNPNPNVQPFRKYDSVLVTNSTLIIKAKEN